MKLLTLISLLATWSWLPALAVGQTQWPIHNDGINSFVEWDHYSFIINGQRLFIWSGEMHYWRAPVPEVWTDLLQKVKALGFNAVSVYAHWGYHNPSDGSLDFESGAHNFTAIFDIAKEIGLYVFFRPGPYVNAETTAGGFPGWVTTGAYGKLRNNDTRYTKAWTPYWTKMSEIIAQYQVSNGGPVFLYQIENEFGEQFTNVAKKTPNADAIAYMENLESVARSSGVAIPLSCNNPNMNTKSWSTDYSNAGGNVNIYGLDSYPSCWSCNLAECTGTNGNVPDFTVVNFYNNFQQVAPTQPSFLTEFQGGSYNPWGGPQGGCGDNTGPDWANVFYRYNFASKVSAMNIYMVYGGTSWGGLAFPTVGTSYDYSAPISESRVIGDKYYETKILAQFVRVARDLTKVDLIGSSTKYTSTPLISTSELRNPDTNAAFYVTIHASSPSRDLTAFSMNVSTSEGNFTIPKYASDIVLNGRESKIIVTDFSLGKQNLVYSTAEILTFSVQDQQSILVLWLPAGESGEFLLTGVKSGQVLKSDGCSGVRFVNTNIGKGGIVTSYTQSTGSCVLQFDDHTQIIVMDRSTAYYTWMPTLSTDPYTPENSTVIVQGPYLVRSVSIENDTIHLAGDWINSTTLEVFTSSSIKTIKFNGDTLQTTKTSYGSLIGQLPQSTYSIASIQASLPGLTNWKVNDGLPERNANYDDSRWVVANHTSTPNPTPPATYPVLYADEYGYHTGNLLWRGLFTGTHVSGVFLKVIGGTSSGWSAYLNGAYIGSWLGNTTTTAGALSLSFANATLNATENVLFVIQDHMGKDETSGALNPRGIMSASLIGGGNFTSWKVAGTAGGEANIDPIRGAYAEGGLHAERLGWHLPGFDDRAWKSGTPESGLTNAGANFYRTEVSLDIPLGLDVSLGFILNAPPGSKLRAQLYVNGYMFGKFVPWIGNQIVFPVLPGILNYHGSNTIGLSIWTQDVAGGSVSVDWTVLGVLESDFDPRFDGTYLRPAWSDRSQYY